MNKNDDKKDLYDVSDVKLDFNDLKKTKWMSEHSLGIANLKNVSPEIKRKLMACFNAECNETGMYLSMARQAYREGYPEVGNTMRQIAFEEAEHASRFLELVGGPVTTSTEKNLEALVKGEAAASLIRYEIASMCKHEILKLEEKSDLPDGANNEWSAYEHIHDSVHEISRDESRHGKAFLGLLNRYFRDKSPLNKEKSFLKFFNKVINSADLDSSVQKKIADKINQYSNEDDEEENNNCCNGGCGCK